MSARTVDPTPAPSGVRDLATTAGTSTIRRALVAAVLVGFAINRTTGMPGAMEDIGNWTEPLGMVSLLIEAAAIWLGTRAWLARD